MSIMGSNLALNISNHGYYVSVFNRSHNKTDKLILKYPKKNIFPFYSIKEFVYSLKKPRCIFLMVKSGKSIDLVINSIKFFLNKGDIIIDGGNSFYKDTIRRYNELKKEGYNFIGAGLSGGEKGALNGLSIMVGGDKNIYNFILPILKNISAFINSEPCVTYVGSNGSGHYVKMIHNGIEYSDMQLIAEVYSLLKIVLDINNNELSEIFNDWNKGELNSYLIEITKNILIKKDNYGKFLIDFILDEADNKGTGKWISKSSLDLGEPLTLITESVFARYISLLKNQRILASKILIGPKLKIFTKNKLFFIEKVRCALYLSKIISYAQGFSQLKIASEKYNWNINYCNIAKIFRAGCIIRTKFLKNIINTFYDYPLIDNILLSPFFKKKINCYQKYLRYIISYGIKNGIPMPVFSSAISYYDSYRSAVLPANLIQAQRDYFGSHFYKRIDKKGIFHTKW